MWVYELGAGFGGTGVSQSLSFMSVNDTPERHRGAGHPLIFALSELQGTRGSGDTETRCLLAKGSFSGGMF